VVDGGIFQTPYCDLYYAKKLGREPTGNTSRGMKSPPSLGASNLQLKPGITPALELMEGIHRGVLVTQLLGLHTANSVTGDFSVGGSGLLIENGKITRPVKGFAVAGNIKQLFQSVSDLGSDLRWFGNIGAPSARIAELAFAGN
jgi:PmbA protein